MPTSLQTNGTVTVTPGAYSEVNASGLAQAGLGATGIVAVIGTGVGGKPYTAIQQPADFVRINTPDQANKTFLGGDLRAACQFLFSPSQDPNIPGGAQQIIAMQANPASAAQALLSNASGGSLTVQAQRYGSYGNQLSILVGAGSSQGRMVLITDGTVTESRDNLGGVVAATLGYVGGSHGWTQVLTSIDGQGNILGAGTAQVTGLTPATGLTQPGSATNLTVAAAAGDVGKVITLHGVDNNGLGVRERVTLQAGSITTSNKYAKVFGVYLSAAASAAVTVSAGSTTVYSVAAGAQGFGSVVGSTWFVANGQVTFTGIPSGNSVIIDGTTSAGTQVVELIAGAGATAVTSTNSYSKINLLVLGGAGTGSISVTGPALYVSAALYPTLQKAASYINSLQTRVSSGTPPGFNMSVNSANYTTPLASVDVPAAKDAAASGGFNITADTYAIASWINSNSQLLTATQTAGANGAPTASSTPTYLVGGAENVATFADVQNCLNLLKQVRVNSVVPLFSDPAVAAATDAHCVLMCGIKRSERDGFVGVMNPTLDGPASLAQSMSQSLALNTKNVRACFDYVTLFNTDTGVATEYPPHFAALVAAGMQAGSRVGTSLTNKYARVLSFRHHPTINSNDNSDALITAGLLFLQAVDGKGIRWVRNVTTYQASINIAYQNAEVNEALNYATYTLRSDLEYFVGQPGFAGTLNQLLTMAKQSLANIIDSGAITGYDSLTGTLSGDAFDVAVQMYPIVGSNFVKLTIYAGNQTVSAAA